MTETKKSYILGSSDKCDIVLRTPHVNPKHMEICPLGNNAYKVRVLDKNSGLYYKSKAVEEATVQIGDVLQIGRQPVSVQWIAARIYQSTLSNMPKMQGETEIIDTKIIGRELPADILLNHPSVSRQHAEVLFSGGGIMLRDLNSNNGTFVNGHRISDWTAVSDRDQIRFGGKRISPTVLDRWLLDNNDDDNFFHQVVSYDLPQKGEILVGRASDCDIIIDDSTVSSRHARLIIANGKITVVDLGSSNGTFVNGTAVRKATLTTASQLQVGQVIIEFGQDGVASNPYLDVRLDAMMVKLDVKDINSSNRITLVNDVSISVGAGEMVALMGPSGAGKTSLLDVLSGKRRPSEGQVLINNIPLHDHIAETKHLIGFVPQDDVMHRDLTVFEVLHHAAKLKLPADIVHDVLVEKVDRLITQMGLAHIRDQIIGDEKTRGISGGQRKRVNIAIELITSPRLLFLDEPTSGLDAQSTLELLQILRGLADEGQTIIMTIHQPRKEAFLLLDNLILLANGGRLAFFGPVTEIDEYFYRVTKIQRDDSSNPADFVLDILEISSLSAEEWKQLYLQSILYEDFLQPRLEEIQIVDTIGYSVKPSFFSQYPILLSTYTKRKLRDRSTLSIQLAQAPVIGILLAELFAREGLALADTKMSPELLLLFDRIPGLQANVQLQNGMHPTIFLLVASVFWLGCSNVARELVADRSVFVRERRALLRTSAYLVSVFTYQFFLSLIQVFQIWILVFLIVQPSLSFFMGLGSLLLVSCCGVGLGLAISATAKNEVSALSTIPLLLIPQLMLGGYIKLYGALQTHPVFSWLTEIMPIRWGFQLLLSEEYDLIIQSYKENNRDMGTFKDVESVIGFSTNWVEPAIFLSCILGVSFLWSYAWLRRDDIKNFLQPS